MRRNGARRSGLSISGIIGFFVLVAAIIQTAVTVYDYIIQRTQDKVLIAVLMLVIVLMLAAVCTVADLVRRKIMIDRPVGRILQATERIATGDFSVRLTPTHTYPKYDEYDVIMENLNVMAAELGKSEVLKSDFISNVSHELKTPLTVIRNYATLLQEEDLDEESRQRYAKSLSDAADRLSQLVTNILKLNKLENQEIKPEMKAFDLTEAVAQAILQYEELIERKEISLECDLQEVTLYSCPSYLELVWSNLLSNAVKFTEQGGSIAVSLKRRGDLAEVTVRDSGCGISAEVGARIFDKFYQGDTSHSGEGNGLGLAMVKQVIDLLGGEITVKSEVGKGSTFTVLLQGAEGKDAE